MALRVRASVLRRCSVQERGAGGRRAGFVVMVGGEWKKKAASR